MAHDDEHDVNRLWQTQPTEQMRMSVEDLRARARKIKKKVDRRNLREYAAAVLVVILVVLFGMRETNVTVFIGGWVMVLGVLYVVYHLQRFGSARSMPSDLALKDCLEFHRAELVRQRDLLRGVWRWYLLPIVPGFAIIQIGRAIERSDWRPLVLSAVIFVSLFVLIGKLNDRGARKLQRIIEGLDRAR
jgi:hypothetical protein